MTAEELAALAAEADLLVNISGHLTFPRLFDAFRRRVLVDIDPGFTQFWHQEGLAGANVEGHDVHFTIGELIGTDGCPIPTGGIEWHPVRQPVVLDDWPVSDGGDAERFTTVATWRGPYGPVEVGGRTYGLKVHEFRKFIELPQRSSQRFEIALDYPPRRRSGSARPAGSRLGGGRPAAGGGRSGCAARLHTGLRRRVLGRPGYVRRYRLRLVQRSQRALPGVGQAGARPGHRLQRHLAGRGGAAGVHVLRRSRSPARRIAADYPAHAAAARALAEERFDSDRVLPRFLEQAGVTWSSAAGARPAPGTGRRGRPESACIAPDGRDDPAGADRGHGRLRGIRGVVLLGDPDFPRATSGLRSPSWSRSQIAGPGADRVRLEPRCLRAARHPGHAGACLPRLVRPGATWWRPTTSTGASWDHPRTASSTSATSILNSGFQANPAAFDDRSGSRAPTPRTAATSSRWCTTSTRATSIPAAVRPGVYLRCWYNAITSANRTTAGARTPAAGAPAPDRGGPRTGTRPTAARWGSSSRATSSQEGRLLLRWSFAPAPQEPAARHLPDPDAEPLPARGRGAPGTARTSPSGSRTPTTGAVAAADHVCAPVSFDEIGGHAHSLTYNTYLQKYMLVSPTAQRGPWPDGLRLLLLDSPTT